ncbi:MAG TPA: SRPBCC family protein [Nitrososphaerales archaeon]|nr:SRPBCC family protein [Nitrososphaerales archaeon]
MGGISGTVAIDAEPEAVWEVLADPHYVPRLYPDMLNIKLEPEGRVSAGQRRTLTGRAGKRMIQFRTKVSEVVPPKRLVIEGCPGGAFESFTQIVELSKSDSGTDAKVSFRFKVSSTYFGIGFDPLTLERMAEDNQRIYVNNLKELSELKRV